MSRFQKGDVVVRWLGHADLGIGCKYIVNASDNYCESDLITLVGYTGTYSSYGFQLLKEEEKVVKPSWFVDVPPTPPSKMIKSGKVWEYGLGSPAFAIRENYDKDDCAIRLGIGDFSFSFRQEGLRKFAKEFNLLVDAMDEIQGKCNENT